MVLRWQCALAALVLVMAAIWGPDATAQAAQPVAAPAAPVTCKVGGFVTSLHDIETASRTFKADLWLWSLCPTKDIEPLKTLEFVSSVETTASLDSILPRGDQWWATRKVSGVFRNDFELDSYPFDRHPLGIEMEESTQDARSLRLTADTEHSGIDPAAASPGWKFDGFTLRSGLAIHPTTFGDPSLTKGDSRYAALHLIIRAERAHFATFIKLTSALYIASFLVLMSLLFDVSNTDLFIGRMGVQASALFAVVLNFVAAGGSVGHHESLSLLDEIHVATLVLVLVTTTWSVFAYRAVAGGTRAAKVRRWDERSAAVFLVLFLIANITLFVIANKRGSQNPAAYATTRVLHAVPGPPHA